jgi:hypothetical protein
MSGHREIQLLLYELDQGTLSDIERQRVLDHLRSCPDCSAERDSMRSVLSVFARPTVPPSEDRSGEFWLGFTDAVENRIRKETTPRLNVEAVLARLRAHLSVRLWRPVTAGAMTLALVLLAFFFAQEGPKTETGDIARLPDVVTPGSPAETGDQVSRYLERSQRLLVGLSNRKVDNDETVDLSAERQLSRQLVREARSLQSQPIDAHSMQLVQNLERILIKVANENERSARSDFEMIRGGIRQENLLFKVRMAEQFHASNRSMGGIQNAVYR